MAEMLLLFFSKSQRCTHTVVQWLACGYPCKCNKKKKNSRKTEDLHCDFMRWMSSGSWWKMQRSVCLVISENVYNSPFQMIVVSQSNNERKKHFFLNPGSFTPKPWKPSESSLASPRMAFYWLADNRKIYSDNVNQTIGSSMSEFSCWYGYPQESD